MLNISWHQKIVWESLLPNTFDNTGLGMSVVMQEFSARGEFPRKVPRVIAGQTDMLSGLCKDVDHITTAFQEVILG